MSNLLSKKSWHVQSTRNRERVRRDEQQEKEKHQSEEKKRKKEESQKTLDSFKRLKPSSSSDHQQLNILDLSSNLIQNSEAGNSVISNSKPQIPEGVSFKSALKYDHQSLFHKVVVNDNVNRSDFSDKKRSTEDSKVKKKKQTKDNPPPSMDDLLKEYQARNAIESAKTKALLEQSKKTNK
ncbi:hypothetical protein C9374_000168 [Naegleria lovaniensis]|uniref:CBF1-interacting co-repressor CIR N-terminal domain-containing protein n=1 Tax=Naegleria lovaniensis TaxID=51637 RepID=A0AA88GZX1_NAELO|nr:uncharacterized protein C9374_000168 [Naegleria lovaniensis]KAG2388729.1 hypothetical protein C9374_000168 [Naegleria lovaniensis]